MPSEFSNTEMLLELWRIPPDLQSFLYSSPSIMSCRLEDFPLSRYLCCILLQMCWPVKKKLRWASDFWKISSWMAVDLCWTPASAKVWLQDPVSSGYTKKKKLTFQYIHELFFKWYTDEVGFLSLFLLLTNFATISEPWHLAKQNKVLFNWGIKNSNIQNRGGS